MLAAFQINANGGDYALAREEFAIDHQHEQLFGNRPLPLDVSTPKDHVSALLAMSADPLPTPLPHLSLDLGLHNLADNRQANLCGQTLQILTCTANQLLQRQLRLQSQAQSTVGFSFGLLLRSTVLSHCWFSCC